ncbi:MAG: RNase adapter RapZ [Terriglobales bacterium]
MRASPSWQGLHTDANRREREGPRTPRGSRKRDLRGDPVEPRRQRVSRERELGGHIGRRIQSDTGRPGDSPSVGRTCVGHFLQRPRFAELIGQSLEISRTALVVDVREGSQLESLPAIVNSVKRMLPTKVIFLEAAESILLRRFSETRRPHPLGTDTPVKSSLATERRHLRYIRAMADLVIDTSRFNVHELRAYITQRFQKRESGKNILVSCVSFGFKHGVPDDADLLFDVRFLPNPHFVPEFRPLTGRDPKVAKYIRSFPQSREFIQRISGLLVYLLPHYIREGKSYLTISFGCTGGQHRSVMIAEDVGKRLRKAGYRVKVVHRDSPG